MNLPTLTAALVAATLALTGCGSEDFDDDCSHYMDDLRDRYGEPGSKIRGSSGDFHAETWVYHSRGFARAFSWEDGSYGSCEFTDSTFPPIRG